MQLFFPCTHKKNNKIKHKHQPFFSQMLGDDFDDLFGQPVVEDINQSFGRLKNCLFVKNDIIIIVERDLFTSFNNTAGYQM